MKVMIRHYVVSQEINGVKVYWVSRGVWGLLNEATQLTGHQASTLCGNLNDRGTLAKFELAPEEGEEI